MRHNPVTFFSVITGATDGIGRAYIEELAKTRGIRKFYLIGRNIDKLNKTRKELGLRKAEMNEELRRITLEETYGCEIKHFVHDFEKDDLSHLPEELKTLDIGILSKNSLVNKI